MKNWKLEFDEMGGYDCLTSSFRIGNALLDGKYYGQESCAPLTADQLQAMSNDARLIYAAPHLLDALIKMVNAYPVSQSQNQSDAVIAAGIAINKALD